MFQTLIGQSGAILNSHFLAILMVKDKHIVWANPGAHNIFGYPPNELIGQPTCNLFVDQQSYETFAHEAYKSIQEHRAFMGTVPQRRKDGSTGWHEFNITPLPEHTDILVGVIVDRTESILAAKQLEESHMCYRSVVEDQTECIARFLPDGTFVFVNEVFCRLFGKSHDDLIGHRWQPIAHPDDIAVIEANLQKLNPENPVVTIENRVLLANGEFHWMQFVNRGFFDVSGTLLETQAVGRIITSLKETETKLRESQETLQRAQAVGKIGSFTMGKDIETFTISLEAARLFGLEGKHLITYNDWFSRVHPADQGSVEKAWQNTLQGEPYDIIFRIIVAGQTRWIRALAELKFDGLGQPIEAVGTCQDITDLKQIESDFQNSEQRLELALQVSELVIWDWDITEHRVTAGKRWFDLLGYSTEELSADEDRWMGLIHSDDLDIFSQKLALHLQGETVSFENQHRLRHKQGHWVTVETKGRVIARDNEFNPLRMIGTILDITDRKRFQEESIGLLKKIESLIGQSGVNLPTNTKETEAVQSLTKRQRQILGMIAAGMTSAEIAKRLNLATKTVISHRQSLMTKLNIHNTAEITRFAINHNLLTSK